MLNSILNCFVFAVIYLFASPQGMAFWWGHLVLAIFSLWNLHRITKFYIFWLFALAALIFSSNPRFSVEYLLILAGLVGFSLAPWWQNKSNQDRRNILLIIFTLLYIIDLKRLALYERGSLLLWFPVFLAIYYNQKTIKNYSINLASGLALSFSNKKTVILAYIASLVNFFKPQYLVLIASLILGISFFYVETISRFLEISLYPRIHIWISCLQGWLAKPIFGHGFGLFAINFPPFRAHNDVYGALKNQQISHGHNLLTHFLFEQGLLGLALVLVIFVLVYRKAREAFLPLVIIALFDAPLVSFSQYFIAALILIPQFDIDQLKYCLGARLAKFSQVIVHIAAILVFGMSIVGHYFYDYAYFNAAIKWDPYNSLYHFTRGSLILNSNIKQSLKDLKRAVELSPNVAFYYGFLAGAQLGNNQLEAANKTIDRAIELDGEEIYWVTIKAFANYQDRQVFEQYFNKALQADSQLAEIIQKPNYSSDAAITGKRGDARVPAFYRRGPNIHLPLPYFEDGLPDHVMKLIEQSKS